MSTKPEGGYYWSLNIIWDYWAERIGTHAAAMLCFLHRAADTNGESYYSIGSTAKKIGSSVHLARKAKRVLLQWGLITIVHKGGSGRGDPDKVRLVHNRIRRVNKVHPSSQKGQRDTQKGSTTLSRSNTQGSNTPNIQIHGYKSCICGEFHEEHEECQTTNNVE